MRRNAVNRIRAGSLPGYGSLGKAGRGLAVANIIDRLEQQSAVGHDHLVRRSQVLTRAVLDGSHALDRPLVVDIDVVLTHAQISQGALFQRVETPVVMSS